MFGRAALCISLLLLAGCGGDKLQSKNFALAPIQTNNDYRVLQTGATGACSGFWLLSVIPLYSPSYTCAEEDLLKKYGSRTAPDGQPVSLANMVKDKSWWTAILFAIHTKHVTADVIEFVGPTPHAAASPPATYLPEGSSTGTSTGVGQSH